MRARIHDLSFGGDGVGKIEGKVCFVEGALPDEEVEFAVLKQTPRYVRGIVSRVITPSIYRVEPKCRYYNRCGGCQLQHLSYPQEVYYKQEQTRQLLGRIGGQKDFVLEPIVASSRDYGYRDTITLHKGPDGYGYFAKDNKTILKIEECPIAAEAISQALAGLKLLREKDDVTIKRDYQGKIHVQGWPGSRFFADEYLGKKMYFSPYAFSQTNRFIAEKIAQAMREWMGDNIDAALFDLYCGAGFFSILLQDYVTQVIGMENNKQAILCAEAAKKEFGYANLKFYRLDVETDFPALFSKYKKEKNILLIDPPREGIAEGLLKAIKDIQGIREIYYVSCNPATLARDVKILTKDSSWRLTRAQSFDMFPRTKHIEVLAKLVCKG